MNIVDSVLAIRDLGLEGDRRCKGSAGSGRQITLISAEHIGLIEHFSGVSPIPPEILRRNLVISGINFSVLRYHHFKIGDAEFEATAACHPCSRMEEALGPGGFAAMYGYGGLCAKIIVGGKISVGDTVEVLPSA